MREPSSPSLLGQDQREDGWYGEDSGLERHAVTCLSSECPLPFAPPPFVPHPKSLLLCTCAPSLCPPLPGLSPWRFLCLSFFLTSSLSPSPLSDLPFLLPPPHPVLPPLPPVLGVPCKSLTWQASSPASPPAHTMLSVILPGNTARQVALETMERLRHWSRSGNGPEMEDGCCRIPQCFPHPAPKKRPHGSPIQVYPPPPPCDLQDNPRAFTFQMMI